MIRDMGLTQEETSRRLGIPAGSLGKWLAASREQSIGERAGGTGGEDSATELARLRKENAELRLEREILKKAAAYFAKESLPGTRS